MVLLLGEWNKFPENLNVKTDKELKIAQVGRV